MKNDINSFVKHVYCCINSKFSEEKKCICCRKFKGDFDHVIRHIMIVHKRGVNKENETSKTKRRSTKTMDIEESREHNVVDVGAEKKISKSKLSKEDTQAQLTSDKIFERSKNVITEADVSSREQLSLVDNQVEDISSSSSSSSNEADEKNSETIQTNKGKKKKKIATKKKKKVKDNDDTVEVENTEEDDDNSEKKSKILKKKKNNKKEGNVNDKKRKKKKITDDIEDQTNDNDNGDENEKSVQSNLSEDDIGNSETDNSTKKTKQVKKGKKDAKNGKKLKKKKSLENKTDDDDLKKLDTNVSLGSDSNTETDIEEIPIGNDNQDIDIVEIDDESDSPEENDLEINNDKSVLNNSNDRSKEFPFALRTTFHQMETVRPDMSVTNTVVAIISTSEFDEDEEKSKQIEENETLNNDPKPLLESNQPNETRNIEHTKTPLPLSTDDNIERYESMLKMFGDLEFQCRQKFDRLKKLAKNNSKYKKRRNQGSELKQKVDKLRSVIKKNLNCYKKSNASLMTLKQYNHETQKQEKFLNRIRSLEQRVKDLYVPSNGAKENVLPEISGNNFPVPYEHLRQNVLPQNGGNNFPLPYEHPRQNVLPQNGGNNFPLPYEHPRQNVFPQNGGNNFPVHYEHLIHDETYMDNVSTERDLFKRDHRMSYY